jgi:hypothetical protein
MLFATSTSASKFDQFSWMFTIVLAWEGIVDVSQGTTRDIVSVGVSVLGDDAN